MSPERGRPVRSLGEALRRLTADLGIGEVHTVAMVARVWPEVVGADVADHARPVRIRQGLLTVEADDPAWASQLRYLGRDVASRLNDALGETAVHEIRVAVARPRNARGTAAE